MHFLSFTCFKSFIFLFLWNWNFFRLSITLLKKASITLLILIWKHIIYHFKRFRLILFKYWLLLSLMQIFLWYLLNLNSLRLYLYYLLFLSLFRNSWLHESSMSWFFSAFIIFIERLFVVFKRQLENSTWLLISHSFLSGILSWIWNYLFIRRAFWGSRRPSIDRVILRINHNRWHTTLTKSTLIYHNVWYGLSYWSP